MSNTNFKLVIAMARSYNALFNKIEKSVHEYGLNMSEFGVLELLLNKGEQPIQKIAEKILVTSGTITYVIDKLVQKNLVDRKKNESDKRIYLVKLTQTGEKTIKEIFVKHEVFLDELLKNMNKESKKSLIESLILLQQAIRDN